MRFVNVYGKAALNATTVKRLFSWANGKPQKKELDTCDMPRSGRQAAVLIDDKTKEADDFITLERITITKVFN